MGAHRRLLYSEIGLLNVFFVHAVLQKHVGIDVYVIDPGIGAVVEEGIGLKLRLFCF